MLKRFALFATLIAVLAACSSSTTEPVPTVTVTETESPAPSTAPSPEPTETKIGDCVIKPGTDCQGDNLRAANLYAANLAHSNLSGTNLQHADLRKANLRRANLQDANLRYANLENARLQGADLSGANLNGARMWWTNLKGANMSGATYQGARLCHTIRVNGTEDNSGCTNPSPSPSPSSSPSSSPTPTQKKRPVVTTLWAEHSAVCDRLGQQTTRVSVQWKTQRATGVRIQVDGKTWNKNAAPNGNAGISLECGSKHTITVIPWSNARGSGPAVSTIVKVKGAKPAPPPPQTPVITQFNVEHTAYCDLLGQQTTEVAIRWNSQDATHVSVAVDGSVFDQKEPPDGNDQVEVDCGGRHQITVTPWAKKTEGTSVSAYVKVKGGGSN
jgi:hypothetical protein